MSCLFRLLNLRPKEGIKVFILLVMLFVFITGFPFAATLLMIAMMSWAMSLVITARAESELHLGKYYQTEKGTWFFFAKYP